MSESGAGNVDEADEPAEEIDTNMVPPGRVSGGPRVPSLVAIPLIAGASALRVLGRGVHVCAVRRDDGTYRQKVTLERVSRRTGRPLR